MVVSTMVTLLGVEAVLRWQAWRSEVRAINALATEQRPTIPSGDRVELREVLVPSRYHDVVFKLQNNLRDIVFCRSRVSTNSLGFRSPEIPAEKGPGRIRVVGIGDSVMFGWGVNDGEDYLARLNTLLNEATPGRRWDVVNTAVPGYNTCMEVATLENRALAFDPDIVIYGYCINDGELPRFLRRTENHLSPSTSYLAQWARGRRFRWKAPAEGELRGLIESQYNKAKDWEGAYDPARVPKEYAHMVGNEGYARALDRLGDLSRRHGFEVVILVHPPDPPDGDLQFQKRGFKVIHTKPFLDRYLQSNGMAPEGFASSPLVIGRACRGRGVDLHPSSEGHRLIAQAMFEGFDHFGYLRESREQWEKTSQTAERN